jgi:hypothetical protein
MDKFQSLFRLPIDERSSRANHGIPPTIRAVLLPSLYKSEELPLFAKEGQREIFRVASLLNEGLSVTQHSELIAPD